MQSHTLSRIDYYNILYANANMGDKKCLKKVLSTAVRFIYKLDMYTALLLIIKQKKSVLTMQLISI